MKKETPIMIEPFGVTPSYRQINHFRYFNKKAFIHFGINTFTGMEWGDGTEDVSIFNPTELDTRQWVRSLKAAGFKLIILTAKHHDGFCLWPSKYTEHTIAKTPYKNGQGDLVREFTDACHELGVNCGIYVSPWDRNSPLWGKDTYSDLFNEQLKELLSNYGRIDEVWWDGAGSSETVYRWNDWANTVRSLQPDAVMFGSMGATPYVECRWVGNEAGYAGDPHYSTIDSHSLEVEITTELNSGKFGGERFIPAEVDVSIRPGWFWHASQDDQVKSVKKQVNLWFNSVGRNAMMLLNFPPDQRGLLPDRDIETALEADKIINKTFSVNLASGAVVTTDSHRDDVCSADCILQDSYDSFYAASDDNVNPIIELQLPKAVTFDTFSIGEKIEYGIRVKGYRIEALVDGAWKVLADKKSMGFLWAEHFDSVTTNRVRIVIYDAAAAPIIRTFGLYKLPDGFYDAEKQEQTRLKNAVDLAHQPGAVITQEKDDIYVNFGGIYPFNTISFNGKGVWWYKIYAFDGSKFYLIYESEKPAEREVIHLEKTIDTAYQIKFEGGENTDTNVKKLDIKVFEL